MLKYHYRDTISSYAKSTAPALVIIGSVAGSVVTSKEVITRVSVVNSTIVDVDVC